MKKVISVLLIFCFCTLITCSDEEKEDPSMEMNRIIPPEYTMSIDFSDINDNSKNKAGGLCLISGVAVVLAANVVCFAPLAIPIAIFRVLRQVPPTSYSDTNVEWNYTYTDNNTGTQHNIVVTADKNEGEYDWEWTVSYNDFTYITGASMEDLTEGWWQFHISELATDTNNFIRVDWTRSDNQNYTVNFQNNDTSNGISTEETYGDYINYTRVDNDFSVRVHDVTDIQGDMLDITVYWDISDETGGITVNPENVDNTVLPAQDCTWAIE